MPSVPGWCPFVGKWADSISRCSTATAPSLSIGIRLVSYALSRHCLVFFRLLPAAPSVCHGRLGSSGGWGGSLLAAWNFPVSILCLSFAGEWQGPHIPFPGRGRFLAHPIVIVFVPPHPGPLASSVVSSFVVARSRPPPRPASVSGCLVARLFRFVDSSLPLPAGMLHGPRPALEELKSSFPAAHVPVRFFSCCLPQFHPPPPYPPSRSGGR